MIVKYVIGDKMKWKIGDVEIANQVVIAPMSGIGNVSFVKYVKNGSRTNIYRNA